MTYGNIKERMCKAKPINDKYSIGRKVFNVRPQAPCFKSVCVQISGRKPRFYNLQKVVVTGLIAD